MRVDLGLCGAYPTTFEGRLPAPPIPKIETYVMQGLEAFHHVSHCPIEAFLD